MPSKRSAPHHRPLAAIKNLHMTPANPRQAAATPAKPPTAAPDSDEELFAHAMQDVAPLRGTGHTRVQPVKNVLPRSSDDDAEVLAELEDLVAGEGTLRLFDSDEELYGMAPGVNHALMRRLRRGFFAFRRHIDLHGMTKDDAKAALVRFVTDARRDSERCVLVVTGRGKGSPDGRSVLKDALPRWLGRAPLSAHVLAFCTAQPVDGGTGAFYLLLRRPGVGPPGSYR